MIINISDRKDTKFLLYSNTLSVEIKFHWQIIAFFLLYRWHSYINNVSLFTLVAILPEKTTSRIKYHDLINLLHTCADGLSFFQIMTETKKTLKWSMARIRRLSFKLCHCY